MKILVTGGLGFIGSNFLNMFVPKYPEHEFYNIDCLTYASNLDNICEIKHKSNYNFIKADISIEKEVNKIFDLVCPDIVIHFAAETHVDRSIKGSKVFIGTNVIGTYNLLESSRKIWSDNDNVFVHISTDEVYGELGDTGSFSELSKYCPNSPYSATKAASDHMVRAWYKTYKLPIKIINCSNNYGPMQFPEKLIPLMTINAINGHKLPIYGKGENVRDWLYVNDHCQAIWQVMTLGEIGETYNVGGSNEKSNNEIIQNIIKILVDKYDYNYKKLMSLIEFVEDRPGHDYRYSVDASKIKTQLNWKPVTSFTKGLSETIKWYINNKKWIDNIKTGKYELAKENIEKLKIYHA